jgi:hypothetical protein
VSSWVGIEILSNPDSHGPGGRSQAPTSARYWRFEASGRSRNGGSVIRAASRDQARG